MPISPPMPATPTRTLSGGLSGAAAAAPGALAAEAGAAAAAPAPAAPGAAGAAPAACGAEPALGPGAQPTVRTRATRMKSRVPRLVAGCVTPRAYLATG